MISKTSPFPHQKSPRPPVMRISLSNCVIVFVVSWVGGLVFIQLFFDVFGTTGKSFRSNFIVHTNEHSDTGVAGLINTVGLKLSYFINPATPAPTLIRGQRRLPKFPSYNASVSTNKSDAMFIYLDWPVDDRLFTIDNYKALESLLNVYPTATFRCLLATSRDAFTHKVGNALSFTQFSKYKKRRYNINTMPLNTKQKSRTTSLGEKYREKWFEKCCGPCNATCRATDHTQPYHLLNYIRLTHLWQNGGIFSDFSYFFLGPITSAEVKQGYQITSWCGNKHHQEQWQLNSVSTSASPRAVTAGDCATSTLLVFNVPQSEALLCVLARYDDATFVDCLESDTTHGGAKCVRNAFAECFESLKLKNGLAAPEESGTTLSEQDEDSSVVEMFGGNAFRATNTLLAVDWDLAPQRRAFWLGSLAWTGSWKNYPYRNATMLGAAVNQINLREPFVPDHSAPEQCKIQSTCAHYAQNLSLLRGQGQTQSQLGGVSLRGRNGYRSEITNGKEDISFGTGIEAASCAPSVVVAGFMKSASSFLFHALTKHPNVLPALRGAQHKETRCYHYDSTKPLSLLDRAWCFPFVEAGEQFVSVDGTVSYDVDQFAPAILKEDNPNMKAIFVVRNPVERLYSNFKFSYNTYAKFGNFDDFIVSGMDLGSKFGDLREMLTNGTDMHRILDVYYNTSYTDGARGALFMHSLYALPVQHYVNILGRENVKVVSAEDLDVQDPVRLYDTLNSVFRFIGVCPVPIADLVPSLPSRNTVPMVNQMSQDMFTKLTRFFKPFNNLLMTLSEVNVTRWNDKTPPAKLPRYSPLNASMPELWFELKESVAGKKRFGHEITDHLLPQRTSAEDSGYNTTLGMLNTF